MRKYFFALVMTISVMALATAIVQAGVDYQFDVIRLLSDGVINNNGQVVWWAVAERTNGAVFLYDDGAITQLTDYEFQSFQPLQLSDNGNVVWSAHRGGSYRVFLFDGVEVKQISNNSYEALAPHINANGHAVWYEYSSQSDGEIFLWDGHNTIQLTDNSFEDQHPQISDNGNVTWEATPPPYTPGVEHREIFLYEASTQTITQLTRNIYSDERPKINSKGDVVWHWPKGLNGYEISLYDATTKTVTQITDNSCHDCNDITPEISDNGDVVWYGWDGHDDEIFLYEASSKVIKQLTDNDSRDLGPNINATGDVVWAGFNNNNWDVYFYDGIAITNVSNSPDRNETWPIINVRKEIVYGSFLARRFIVGDFNRDNVVGVLDYEIILRDMGRGNADFYQDKIVDQKDFQIFQNCMSGPAIPYANGCERSDFDKDGDVDMSDFGMFQLELGLNPPNSDVDGNWIINQNDLSLFFDAYRKFVGVDSPEAQDSNGNGVPDGLEDIVPPPNLTNAAVQKVHGTQSADLGIPLDGSRIVEPRQGGIKSVILIFNREIRAKEVTVTASKGNAVLSIEGNQITVALSGLEDGDCTTFTLDGIQNQDKVLQIMQLLGDTNGDGVVNIVDLSQIKNRLFQPVSDGDNFKSDINTDGNINIVDLQTAKSRLFRSVSEC